MSLHFFKCFLNSDIFHKITKTDFASHADDITPDVPRNYINNVIKTPKEHSVKRYRYF